MIVARTITAVAVAIPAAAVATTPVPAVLVAFAFRPWRLALGGGLMQRLRVAGWRGLLRPRLLALLRRALLLSALISPIRARSPIGSRPAIGPSILALPLAVALLLLALAVALLPVAAGTLFEPAMLLAVAAAAFAAATAVTSSVAAAVAALLLVAARIALMLLRLCLSRRRGGRCYRGRPWLEDTH